jgi:lipopolysaccharide transport protein LptA
VNFEFNSDLKLKQFRAEKKVKMVDKEAGAGSSRQVEGREMSVQGTTNILQVAGEADKVAKMSSEESLIDAQKLQIHLEKNDFGAQGSVKAIFRPAGGKKEAFGFFSKEQPVFLTAQEMRYFKEEKRFLFNENIRIWQEKEMLFGQKIILWEETGAMTGEGQMKSIFAHQLKDKKKEERIEISAEKMGYNPKENLLTFEAQSALKVKNANLTAQSILVYPQEDRSGLKQILAKGNVVIVQDLREGSGNEAVYDVSAETIVITGNPVLKEKDKGAIDGDKLTFYLADGKIAIENKERERSVTFIKS